MRKERRKVLAFVLKAPWFLNNLALLLWKLCLLPTFSFILGVGVVLSFCLCVRRRSCRSTFWLKGLNHLIHRRLLAEKPIVFIEFSRICKSNRAAAARTHLRSQKRSSRCDVYPEMLNYCVINVGLHVNGHTADIVPAAAGLRVHRLLCWHSLHV